MAALPLSFNFNPNVRTVTSTLKAKGLLAQARGGVLKVGGKLGSGELRSQGGINLILPESPPARLTHRISKPTKKLLLDNLD